MKRIIFITTLLVLLTACNQTPTTIGGSGDVVTGSGSTTTTIEEKTAGWNVYGEEGDDLYFKYPADWDVKVSKRNLSFQFSFGQGEEINFTVSELPTPHERMTVLAKELASEKEEWVYSKYLSKGKYFYNVFQDFNPAMGRTYMNGTVYYAHIGSPTSQNEYTPGYKVEFDMNALDVELEEAKAILKEAKYKSFWYILHTMEIR